MPIMIISLNDKMKVYIDTKGSEILNNILHEKAHPKAQDKIKAEPSGYLKHKEIYDLGEIIGHMDVSKEGFDKKLVFKTRNFSDEKVGYNEKGFLEIYSLVKNFLKEDNISKLISETFLVDNIFEWLVGSYRKEIIDTSLSDFIITKCLESIIEYKIYLPILYLESDKEFSIGNVRFQYLTEEYIRKLSQKIELDKRDEYIKSLLSYKGQFMANCILNAEKKKAIELSIQHITFSIDILRIVSPTVEIPEMQIFYDVDFRNIHQLKNDVLIQPIKDESHFMTEFSRKAIPFCINEPIWNYMLQRELDLLNQFTIKTLNIKSELESLVCNAIRNFSKAIANHDQHERITQIFTVLESLLLPDDSAPIIDSVCKYLPKLISKNLIEREKIIETVKEMYKVRSAMMHHAKRKEFLSTSLAIIQKSTRALILHLIILSNTNQTKREILKRIDDNINRA